MSARPRILHRKLAPSGTLPGDFVTGEPAARRLLRPTSESGDEGTHADKPYDASRTRLTASGFGTSDPEAGEKLDRILAGEGSLVTTGQQPVLFLGPMYVLYKALTAIETARRLEERTGRPCLAVFWVASDDHDWEEIGVTRLLDSEDVVHAVRVQAPDGRANRAVGATRLPNSTGKARERLGELLPLSEFVGPCRQLLADHYGPSVTFGQAFAGALRGVLAGHSYAWVDAASTAVKEASAPLFRRVLQESAAAQERLAEATEAVRRAGYEPRIPLLPDAAPLFVDTGRRRVRLYLADETARLGRGGKELPLPELQAWLEDSPADFSPNVELRPVLESWLMPVHSTVLGPGEIAYWAQLTGLFQRFGVPFPNVVPRTSLTIVERKIDRILTKLSLDPDELADGADPIVARLTRAARADDLDAALGALRDELGRRFEDLEEVVREALPGVLASVSKASKKAWDVVDGVERQIDRRVKEEQQTAIAQVHRCVQHLFPEGRPQERVQSPFYFLSRYGPELVGQLEESVRESLEGDESAPAG
jgi:bacillithiol biosynthesis cysteine-adding enzyme BshC